MAIRKVSLTQTGTGAWAATSTVSTDLEQVGVITQIDVTVELTPSATLSAAHQEDAPFRPIQNFSIRGGSHTYFTLPADPGGQPGVLWHYINKHDGYGVGHAQATIVAPFRTYMPVTWVFHCGTRHRDVYGRRNPFDLSAFIPASQEQQLKAEWATTGNDVMDDVVTIASATMRFTIHRILGSDAEIAAEMARQAVNLPPIPGIRGMVPAYTARVISPTTTHSDFSREEDLPLGKYLARMAFLAQDATATRPLRAADELTGIKLALPGSSEDLIKVFVDQLTNQEEYGTAMTDDSGAAVNAAVATQASVDFDAAAPSGIFIVDLKDRGENPWNRDYGLDLRNKQTGAAKLGLTISTNASGDDVLMLFEQYQPYHGLLAPAS